MSSVDVSAELLAIRPQRERVQQDDHSVSRTLPSIQTASGIKSLVAENAPEFGHAKARIAYGSCVSQVVNVGFEDGYSMVKQEAADPEAKITGIIEMSDVVDYATEGERFQAAEHLAGVYGVAREAGQLAVGNDRK